MPELIPFAGAAAHPVDFRAHVPYIMSALFLYACEFNPDELQNIFEGIVPNGVGGDELKECRQLFEKMYQ